MAKNNSSAYVPMDDGIYSFISTCIAKELLPLSTLSTQPLSRSDIAMILYAVTKSDNSLMDNNLQQDMDFYCKEYSKEIIAISKNQIINDAVRTVRRADGGITGKAREGHWHIWQRESEEFSIVFDPIVRFSIDADDEYTILRRTTGIALHGTAKSKIGYYFRFTDSVERGKGKYGNRNDLLDDNYGYVGPLQSGEETYYDMTEAYLTFQSEYFRAVFGKDRLRWGGMPDEGLLLSGLGPSYDHFRWQVEFLDIFKFDHVVAQLRPFRTPEDTLYKTNGGWVRSIAAPKWLAAHKFEVMPWDWVIVGFGEAVVWGERDLDIAYLNPLNFYYSAEHDGGDQDNALMWGYLLFRLPQGILMFGELLLDDLKLSTLGEGDPGNRIGVAGGVQLSNLKLDGLRINADYTRLQPYVYSHFYPVNRYSTWTTSLGSDLPPNADRFRLNASYRPTRKLEFSLELQSIRHGDRGAELLEGIPAGSDPIYFLSDNYKEWVGSQMSVNFELYPYVFIEIGNINNDELSFMPDRYYVSTSYRF
ncbi:hypothetical protein ACFLQV_00555 [Calditrichota bacterium]